MNKDGPLNVFKMKKANFDDIWETNFLLCCIPMLTEAVKFINRLVHSHSVPHPYTRQFLRENIGFWRDVRRTEDIMNKYL